MEKKKSIEEILENTDKKIILKRKKSPVAGILTFISGIVFYVIQTSFNWNINSPYPHLFFICGAIFILVGVVMYFTRKPYFVFTKTNQKLIPAEIYFDANELDKLTKIVEKRQFEELKKINLSQNNNLKIRFLSTADDTVCYSQIQKYIPFEYSNINDPLENTPKEAQILKGLIKNRA